MKTKPSDTVIRAWARLNKAQHQTMSLIERALKNAGMPPLAWYDVLLELARTEQKSLRPFELEKELYFLSTIYPGCYSVLKNLAMLNVAHAMLMAAVKSLKSRTQESPFASRCGRSILLQLSKHSVFI